MQKCYLQLTYSHSEICLKLYEFGPKSCIEKNLFSPVIRPIWQACA
jgi:hypothetical protein